MNHHDAFYVPIEKMKKYIKRHRHSKSGTVKNKIEIYKIHIAANCLRKEGLAVDIENMSVIMGPDFNLYKFQDFNKAQNLLIAKSKQHKRILAKP